MDVTGDKSKVWCCKEQYCIGTWNVRSKNQGKSEVVKQEMARVNVDILGISKLKWTGMGEFNSDDHYIHYCGQESLKRNRVAIMVNKNLKRSQSVNQSVQLRRSVRRFATPWIAARQASLSITNSWSSQTHVHRVGDTIQPSHPWSSPSPPAPNPSQH